MSDQLPDPTAFVGHIGRGKAPLPGDADADQYTAVLRRALHAVECRELGPEAAGQKFGPFADTSDGRVTVLVDEHQIRDRHPGHDELHHLAHAVREGGPAVDVVMVPPKPTMLFMDEMAHVVSKVAEPACGPALAGPTRWVYEPSRPLRPLRWYPGGCPYLFRQPWWGRFAGVRDGFGNAPRSGVFPADRVAEGQPRWSAGPEGRAGARA